MADAPKLQGTERLGESYYKINMGIDNANEALKRSYNAESKSGNAINIASSATNNANAAVNKAESVQKQLDTIVINGDSSVEAAQAREDVFGEVHKTLQERLNGSQYKAEAPKIQSVLYGKAFQKLRTGKPTTICCLGDSMTYGHDTTSADKRPADPAVLPDGSKHTATRASVTYPESLQKCLDEVYPGQVTVINRGYSGDGTKSSHNRWMNSPSGADITLINLGINDSRASWIEYKGNIEEYIKWYERIILRELWAGSALIMLTPPKLRSASDLNVDVFANSLISLANYYGIPLIDSEVFMSNYSTDVYSDDTHYNGKGYNIYGARIASIFVGEGAGKPFKISSGSRILTRPTLDNIVLRNANFKSSSGVYTPAEMTASQGIHVQVNDNGSVFYSFYTETEDTIIIPMFFISNGSGGVDPTKIPQLDISLNFGVEQGDYCIDHITGVPNSFTNREPSSISVILDKSSILNKLDKESNDSGQLIKLHIVTKGWHTLKMNFKQNNPNAYCLVHGLEVLNYRSLESTKKTLTTDIVGSLRYLTHNTSGDTSTVSESRIKALQLRGMLNLPEWKDQYFKSIPLKVTVFNYDQTIIEYGFILHCDGITNSTFGFKYLGQIRRTDISTTPSSFREIDTITFDNVTMEYVIKWKGSLNRPTSFIIQPL